MTSRLPVFVGSALLLLVPQAAAAQAADPDPNRYANAIETFERWDSKNATPADPVLFVGSSSIVGWPTADRFPELPVINRGFGGSQISDVNHFIEQTVLKHEPEQIIFYAGNNDIHDGKSPAQVLEDYQQFVRTVRQRLPETEIIYISIHPSPARWSEWDRVQAANALIRDYSVRDPLLGYVDIATPMLGRNGAPMPDLFVDDGLHLNPSGYDIWTPLVARAIAEFR